MHNRCLSRVSSVCLLAFLFLCISSFAFSQDTGTLRLRVSPSVAGVFIDEKYQGTVSQFQSSKSAIVVPAGEHRVEIIDPRYEPISQVIDFKAGQNELIREQMKPKSLAQPPFGELKVKNGNRAAVYINNAYFGQADEFNGPGQALLLNPGEYNLRIVPPGGGSPLEQKVTITTNQTTTITM